MNNNSYKENSRTIKLGKVLLIGYLIVFIIELFIMLVFNELFDRNDWLLVALLDPACLVLFSYFFILRLFKSYKRNHFYAYHDTLTHFLNLRGLHTEINIVLQTSETEFALLILDIYKFKRVNDSIGHYNGDRVLKIFANRLTVSLDENIRLLLPLSHYSVCRKAGDEFFILISNLKKIENHILADLSQKLLSDLKQPLELDGYKFILNANVGIDIVRRSFASLTPEDIIRNVYIALHAAKVKGINNIDMYNSQINSASNKIAVEHNLLESIVNDKLFIIYQPLFSTKDCTIQNVEALIRCDLNGEILSPDAFIPIAEETGLIITVGKWIIDACFKQLKEWHKNNHNLNININLSVKQITPDLVEYLKLKIEEFKINPSNINFEITESVMMYDEEYTINLIRTIRSLGFGISIDDFGSGYTSIGYLDRLPVSQVKIDKIFIRRFRYSLNNPSENDKIKKLFSSLAEMLRSLRLSIVVEGIQTKEEFDFVSSLDIDLIQGYYISKPLAANKLIELLSSDEIQDLLSSKNANTR